MKRTLYILLPCLLLTSCNLYKYSDDIKSAKNMETIKIPEDHYFLMGDFRSEALDSRYIGTIPSDQIIGKIIKITPKKNYKNV